MARRGCRDCPRCTESCLGQLIMLPFRVAWQLLTCWNLGLIRRHCPECGHLIKIHTKVGGRFAD